ncbi:CD40 ligand [Hyperolius riggenbachi]|uniref:CD40 ligand n=1 Tax=Hyperolius riggenbachi TaxID=752182 RepID=UPI0035A31869
MYPTQQGSAFSIMKIALWIFIVCVLGQIIGICIFGVYFHTKLDKIEEQMEFNEDYLFLRRIQKCLKGKDVDPTLLNCQEVVAKFRSLISEVTKFDQPGEHEKLTDKRDSFTTPQVIAEPITPKTVPAVAIHLVGDKANSNKEGLQWQEKGYLTLHNQIGYTNGRVRVEVPGAYYVYSQVTFCANSTQFLKAPFVQYVYLKRENEADRILLKGANTFISQTANCALHSSQPGAIFTLRKNDLVYVRVTDPACVTYSPEYTYFGMFKVGDTS